jgi:hypothetical protein
MNAELREAVEMKQLRKFATALDAESIRPELAAWNAVLTAGAMSIRRLADIADEQRDRADKAEALLREALSFLSINHPVGQNTANRITAHLGGENNG